MQQQRQLRLGDILDDYCPRERRLANHTVVAMVGDEVRLTRCTTCETEHPYKGGKAPRLRKKTPAQAAYDEVLESVKKDTDAPGTLVTPADAGEDVTASEPVNAAPPPPASADPVPDAEPTAEQIRLHRPLIRASLPRVETQQTARPIPEFTIRQASRQGRFQNPRAARFAKGRGGEMNNSGNTTRGNGLPQGGRHGGRPQGQGHGAPGRPGQGGQGRHAGQHHSNKKRSR